MSSNQEQDHREFRIVTDNDQVDDNSIDKEGHDPFDPSRYILSQDYVETGGCSEVLTTLKVKRFSKNTFFRAHPDPAFRVNVGIMMAEEGLDREVYLIDPNLYDKLHEHMLTVTLYLGISRAKVLQLIPVRLPSSTAGAGESWAKSLRLAMDVAMQKWIKIIADRDGGFYRVHVAPGTFAEPEWPEKYASIRDMLKIAFADRVLSNQDHPVIRRLDGWE